MSYCDSIGKNGTGLSSDSRLIMLVLGRADKYGHAEFGSGELSLLLGVQEPAVVKLIAKLVKAGLAVQGSKSRCVWLAYELRGGGRPEVDPKWGCDVHGRLGAGTVTPAPETAELGRDLATGLLRAYTTTP
ncbi:hypothetical protein ACFVYR_14080 [Streptomyces sp. NPDC058284]|uniref:hypothetical protein n=1 Tax=unclassified Streptomyces TaxID=2593676 RepID=UPI003652004D